MTPSIYEERLTSVRARIAVVRAALEDPTTLSDVSIDGASERFDRRALREELKELEAQEVALENQIAGRSTRVYKVDLR